MWRDVATPAAGGEGADRRLRPRGGGALLLARQAGAGLALGRHGVLERALGGPVLAGADAALDLGVLEAGLLLLELALVLGRAGLPVDLRPEHDVLGDASRVRLRPRRLAGLLAELRPVLALRTRGFTTCLITVLRIRWGALYFAAGVVEPVAYDCFRAVFVLEVFGCGDVDGIIVVSSAQSRLEIGLAI